MHAPTAMAAGAGVLSPHWGAILGALDQLLETLKAAHVPRFLVNKLFQQVRHLALLGVPLDLKGLDMVLSVHFGSPGVLKAHPRVHCLVLTKMMSVMIVTAQAQVLLRQLAPAQTAAACNLHPGWFFSLRVEPTSTGCQQYRRPAAGWLLQAAEAADFRHR